MPAARGWERLADQGRLVGFDANRRRLIGSFGPDGFTRAGEESGRFEGKLYSPTNLRTALIPDYLAFPNGVYTVVSK